MKQETLEKFAEKLYPVNNTGSMFMANRDELNNSLKQEGFIEGAKWQAERMYSEEEVADFIIDFVVWYEEEVLAKGDYNLISKPKKELLETFKKLYDERRVI
jgi:hypothetical protein